MVLARLDERREAGVGVRQFPSVGDFCAKLFSFLAVTQARIVSEDSAASLTAFLAVALAGLKGPETMKSKRVGRSAVAPGPEVRRK